MTRVRSITRGLLEGHDDTERRVHRASCGGGSSSEPLRIESTGHNLGEEFARQGVSRAASVVLRLGVEDETQRKQQQTRGLLDLIGITRDAHDPNHVALHDEGSVDARSNVIPRLPLGDADDLPSASGLLGCPVGRADATGVERGAMMTPAASIRLTLCATEAATWSTSR